MSFLKKSLKLDHRLQNEYEVMMTVLNVVVVYMPQMNEVK